jgi:GLPGLI family protein
MKKYFLILLLLTYTLNAQKIEISTNIKVTYDAKLKLGNNFQKNNETFILIGNSQNYYFGIDNLYLFDSGKYTYKGGIDTNTKNIIFNERVIKANNKVTVYTVTKDSKIRYEEPASLQWVLYSDTKIINGVKCQMAAINKYGRRWIAYFSKDYPQSLGPYKFNGLPGLIFELYDTRDDYHFTVTKVEKDSEDFRYNLTAYKLMSKKNYLQARYNMEFTIAGFPDMDEEMRKQTQEIYDKKKKMFNNPLELKPFE